MRTIILTLIALVAFAANSVLCRLALGQADIDAASFSTVRLASGAVVLLFLSRFTPRASSRLPGTWTSAGVLFLYAIPFSFAYLSLGAGTGALILFGSVQATMMLTALATGQRPHPWQWLGLLVALGGLVGLVFPGLTAPPLLGSALMAVAGTAWGIYSLRGRRSTDPLGETTGNFVRAAPLTFVVNLLAFHQFHVSSRGVLLAVGSGAVASALGYIVWYSALRGLTAIRAAVVQLSVPVLAAAGGIGLLHENLSLRIIVAGSLILGGIGLALAGKERA